jgi:glycerol-3-phosphate acyltransferase PlsY
VLVTLPKAKEALAIDLSQKNAPRMAGRMPLAVSGPPYVSVSDDHDWIIMPTLQDSESVILDCTLMRHGWGSYDPWSGCLLYTRPEESALELAQSPPGRTLGRFPVKGPFNLGGACPTGLAILEGRRLVAVATKSGAVHLVSIRSRLEDTKDERPNRIAETAISTERQTMAQ